MRKPDFCICEIQDADRLRGNHEADQRLCFRCTDGTIPNYLNPKFQASSHLLWMYSRLVWDLVGNPEDRFSHNEVHIYDKVCFSAWSNYMNSPSFLSSHY